MLLLDKRIFTKYYHLHKAHCQLKVSGENCCVKVTVCSPCGIMEMQGNPGFNYLEGVKAGDRKRFVWVPW